MGTVRCLSALNYLGVTAQSRSAEELETCVPVALYFRSYSAVFLLVLGFLRCTDLSVLSLSCP